MRKHQLFCLLAVLFLVHSFSFSASAQNSLGYDGTDDYTTLPAGVVSNLSGDYTIEAWVYWRGASTSSWQRVFDFGSNTTVNMFLTTNGSINAPRFAITTAGGGGEQRISATTPLSLNTWHHMAVVIQNATNTGTLYIDGTAAAANTAMTLRPSALGTTTANYFGRSQYADPYFNGYIDEVRISNSARYLSDFTPQHTNFAADANTVALYHFDEPSGQTVTDATGNFSGVLGATNAVETTDPTRASISVLPVSLHDFRAAQSGNDVTLSWHTSNEQSNKGFYVERSVNGVQFMAIGFVPAHPGGDYSFADANVTSGNFYYRLKQVDQDGRFTYSTTLFVALAEKSGRMVWNKTSSGSVELRLTGGNSEVYRVNDMNGRLLQQGSLNGGKTVISSLSAGIYTVTVQTQNGKQLSTLVRL